MLRLAPRHENKIQILQVTYWTCRNKKFSISPCCKNYVQKVASLNKLFHIQKESIFCKPFISQSQHSQCSKFSRKDKSEHFAIESQSSWKLQISPKKETKMVLFGVAFTQNQKKGGIKMQGEPVATERKLRVG